MREPDLVRVPWLTSESISRESTGRSERAALKKSTALDERADGFESAVVEERVVLDESAEVMERADDLESTVKDERLGEGAQLKTVYRFALGLNQHQALKLPHGAVPLHLAIQERAPHAISLWVLCDPEQPEELIELEISGTGVPAPEWASLETYLGTVQVHGFVWHFWMKP